MNKWLIIFILELLLLIGTIIFYNNISTDCEQTINNKYDILNLAKCVRSKFVYEPTNNGRDPKLSLLYGKGDCKDMSEIMSMELSNRNITNIIQVCDYDSNDSIAHARNIVWFDDEKYLLDIVNTNIYFKKFDYGDRGCKELYTYEVR